MNFKILFDYWWVPETIITFLIFWRVWLYYAQNRYLSLLNWVLLEIRVPKNIERTPKSMEEILAVLHGAAKSGNLIERYVFGFIPNYFSLEILGKNGAMHFFIRTQEMHRNLVESQIYAQYPDAEISAVDDYTFDVPYNIPNQNWTTWSSETILTGDSPYYPIRTYYEFKDEAAPEGIIDPLASLSETISHLAVGEQIWLQILITPTHKPWQKLAKEKVAEIIGAPVKKSEDVFDKLTNKLYSASVLTQAGIRTGVLGRAGMDIPKTDSGQKDSVPSLMQYLSPGEKKRAEAIEQKASKLGFETKIRFLYLAKKDVFNAGTIAAFWGGFKQYAIQDLAGFAPDPDTKTSVDYFFADFRKNFRRRKNLKKYRSRSISGKNFILNIEELASIYYIPGTYVQAPGIERLPLKKGEAPLGLPVKN